MTKKHLLFWVFTYLSTNHPDVLKQMLEEIEGDFGDGASSTVNKEFSEYYKKYQDVKDKTK